MIPPHLCRHVHHLCRHHQHWWQLPPPSSAATTTIATTNAVSRMVADRHYVSDVIAGVGIGLAGGFLLPLLAHYRPPISDEAQLAIVPVSGGGTQGLAVVGIF